MSYASVITANFMLKKFIVVRNPFLFLVGCAERESKAPFTSATPVDEKKIRKRHIAIEKKAKKYFRLCWNSSLKFVNKLIRARSWLRNCEFTPQ